MRVLWAVATLAFVLLAGCGERPSVPAPYRHHAGGPESFTVKVQRGDSVSKIAVRYGVPIQKLIVTNNLKPPYKLFVGQSLVIVAGKQPTEAPFKVTMPPLDPKPQPSISVEELSPAGEKTEKTIHPHEPLTPDILPGQENDIKEKLAAPLTQGSAHAPSRSPSKVEDNPEVHDPVMPIPEVPLVVKKNPPIKKRSLEQEKDKGGAATPKKKPALASQEPKPPTDETSVPQRALAFRWPTHGDIIRAYKKGKNDGINIAAPEGTQVFAAEEGTVAYVGDKLPGFGNLIMIKHRNGWMTAYAHTKDVMVKRDEKVKKGQQIAKVGQTGNVNTPQLHFEIRKRTQAVDPEPLLE